MATAPLYNVVGERMGDADLDDAVFGRPSRPDLLYLAVNRELANRRAGTHDTKTRAEVSGGGHKPYRQKGTGHARQGSTRAPQHRHGGVVHGPHPRSHEKDMPRKMRRLALLCALSSKVADGSVKVLEDLQPATHKTREFKQWLDQVGTAGHTLVVTAQRGENLRLAARNLPGVRVAVLPGLSTYEVMRADTLLLTRAAVDALQEAYAG
ncbi:MAG: 50S ribosomal protein L4 [Armatimonadetes bacterium]|nr:50S ribosomal protein L4 [Armatimonadota bacterium]